MKRSSTDSDSAAVADKREKMEVDDDEAEEDLWQHLPFWGSDCCDTDELMELIQDTSVSGVDQCSVFADIYNDGDYSVATTEQLIELFDPFPDEDVSAGEPRFFARIYNDDTGATEQVIELEDPFSSDDDSDSSELYQLNPVETAESTLQKKKVR